jgi:hypothetical protein
MEELYEKFAFENEETLYFTIFIRRETVGQEL